MGLYIYIYIELKKNLHTIKLRPNKIALNKISDVEDGSFYSTHFLMFYYKGAKFHNQYGIFHRISPLLVFKGTINEQQILWNIPHNTCILLTIRNYLKSIFSQQVFYCFYYYYTLMFYQNKNHQNHQHKNAINS